MLVRKQHFKRNPKLITAEYRIAKRPKGRVLVTTIAEPPFLHRGLGAGK